MTDKETIRSECYYCQFSRKIVGDCHLFCSNPDYDIMGNPHGIENGWFHYPLNFDPVWKETKCNHFKLKKNER